MKPVKDDYHVSPQFGTYTQKCPYKEAAEKWNNLKLIPKFNNKEFHERLTELVNLEARLKKEQKKNQEDLDELLEEEKTGFVSEEYKEQLQNGKSFFQKILGE